MYEDKYNYVDEDGRKYALIPNGRGGFFRKYEDGGSAKPKDNEGRESKEKEVDYDKRPTSDVDRENERNNKVVERIEKGQETFDPIEFEKWRQQEDPDYEWDDDKARNIYELRGQPKVEEEDPENKELRETNERLRETYGTDFLDEDNEESQESQRKQNVQNMYDQYLQETEGRGASYGEIAYIDSLSGKDLDDFEKELDDDYEYNLYKRGLENEESIDPMTEWSTDWEDLDNRYRDRYKEDLNNQYENKGNFQKSLDDLKRVQASEYLQKNTYLTKEQADDYVNKLEKGFKERKTTGRNEIKNAPPSQIEKGDLIGPKKLLVTAVRPASVEQDGYSSGYSVTTKDSNGNTARQIISDSARNTLYKKQSALDKSTNALNEIDRIAGDDKNLQNVGRQVGLRDLKAYKKEWIKYKLEHPGTKMDLSSYINMKQGN